MLDMGNRLCALPDTFSPVHLKLSAPHWNKFSVRYISPICSARKLCRDGPTNLSDFQGSCSRKTGISWPNRLTGVGYLFASAQMRSERKAMDSPHTTDSCVWFSQASHWFCDTRKKKCTNLLLRPFFMRAAAGRHTVKRQNQWKNEGNTLTWACSFDPRVPAPFLLTQTQKSSDFTLHLNNTNTCAE